MDEFSPVQGHILLWPCTYEEREEAVVYQLCNCKHVHIMIINTLNLSKKC